MGGYLPAGVGISAGALLGGLRARGALFGVVPGGLSSLQYSRRASGGTEF